MMSGDRLKAFLRDVQAGQLTRHGYERFALHWAGRPALRALTLDVAAAERLGLITWNGRIGPVPAELTDAGRVLLRSAPVLPSDLELWAAKWGAPMDARADLRRMFERRAG